MANIKSAKKRIRVIERKTQRNRRVKSHLKEILKDFEKALAAEDQKTARNKLALAEKRLMQAVSKGTVHKNTASRKVSRITAAFIKAFGKEALLEKADISVIPDRPAKADSKPEKKTKAETAAETSAEEAPDEEKKSAKKSTKKASIEEADTKEEAAEETEEAPAEETAEPESEAEAEATEEPAAEAETEAEIEEVTAEKAEETPAEEASQE